MYLTGGTSGIGFECAKQYTAECVVLVVVSNNAASLEAAKKNFYPKHSFIYCDVSVHVFKIEQV